MPTFLDTPVTISNPTADGTYRTVDLSANVPAGATGVIIEWDNNAGATRTLGIRSPDAVYDIYENVPNNVHDVIFCGVNSNREIEVKLSGTGITLYLHGYFGAEATFLTDIVDVTPSSTSTWEDQNISTTTGTDTAIAAIVCRSGNGLSGGNGGVRWNGSVDTVLQQSLNSQNFAIVKVDSNEIFESYLTLISGRTWDLVGYITSGLDLLDNPTYEQPALANTYETSSETYTLGAVVWARASGSSQDYTVTYDNTAFAVDANANSRYAFAMVKADGSGNVEFQASNVGMRFYRIADVTTEADLTGGAGGGGGSNVQVTKPKDLWKPT